MEDMRNEGSVGVLAEPTFSQDIVLTRRLHLPFSQVLKLNMSHISSASFPSTLLLLGSSQSLP